MLLRFDGYLGFPGGLINTGEDLVKAINRTMVTVMNLDSTIHSIVADDYLISHWSKKNKSLEHCYKLKVTMNQLAKIEICSLHAKNYGIEVIKDNNLNVN